MLFRPIQGGGRSVTPETPFHDHPWTYPRGIRTRFRVDSPRGFYPPFRLCSKMCSRPCLLFTNRYKKGGTNSPVPPTVSYYLQLLPKSTAPFLSDSKSRGRKVVRVRPPPPAPYISLITSTTFLLWLSRMSPSCSISMLPRQFTSSISPGRHVLSNHGSSAP